MTRFTRWIAGRLRSEDGSAVVEFVTIGVLLLVPVLYLVVSMGRVQAASFAVEGAARESARVIVSADSASEGQARSLAATRWALADQGFTDDPADALQVGCSASPCLTPGAEVSVTVSLAVQLPGVPAGLPAVVPVSATHTQVVDEFRALP